MFLPRLLLFRPPGGGDHQQAEVEQRFQDFARGHWVQLLDASRSSAQISSTARVRQRRRGRNRTQDVEKRAAKAAMMVQLGDLSTALQALEGADLAPGTPATLAVLRDPARRPERPQDPIS